MVSFEELEIREDLPIYLQIIRYVKLGIIAGIIKDEDAMPSRRMLSALLGINPNTIQKAYRILEEENLLQSKTGAKSFITVQADTVHTLRKELIELDVTRTIVEMQKMGMDKVEALKLVELLWDDLLGKVD